MNLRGKVVDKIERPCSIDIFFEKHDGSFGTQTADIQKEIMKNDDRKQHEFREVGF